MILYNVTVKIDPEIQEEWVRWMQQEHIPDVMNTGLFREYKMCRLLEQDESDGITYAIQYFCETMDDYKNYQQNFAPALKQQHWEKYQNKFVAFRTIMEVL